MTELIQNHPLAKYKDIYTSQLDIVSAPNGGVAISEIMVEEFFNSLESKRAKYENFRHTVWSSFTQQSLVLLDKIKVKSYEEKINILDKCFTTELTSGFDQGDVVYKGYINNKEVHNYHATIYVDCIFRLASYFEILPLYNAEQGDFKKYVDINMVLKDIDDIVKFSVTGPSFYGGALCLSTDFGLHTNRSITAIYIANLLKSKYPLETPIVEIGGGSGMQAFYLHKAGFKNISIVDLPHVSFIQSYFLEKNIPNHGIKIIDAEDWDDLCLEKSHGVVLNIDSFPEMPLATLRSYLSKTFRGGYSLESFNQNQCAFEVQHSVFKEANAILTGNIEGARYTENRNLFWMRDGYVHNSYVKQNKNLFFKFIEDHFKSKK